MKKTKKLKDIEFKEHLVDKKQMVVVYFDYKYPIGEEDISQVTQTISNIINVDRRFINRCIFLPKGFDMYNLTEDDFISIWKSKVDADDVDKIIDETKDPNQLELFNEKEIIE
mgnify:CR=1 FL=1